VNREKAEIFSQKKTDRRPRHKFNVPPWHVRASKFEEKNAPAKFEFRAWAIVPTLRVLNVDRPVLLAVTQNTRLKMTGY